MKDTKSITLSIKKSIKTYLICILLLLTLIFNLFLSNSIVIATDISEETLLIDDYEELGMNEDEILDSIVTVSASVTDDFPSINSKAYVVIDRLTGSILIGNNELEINKMASTTKIMTCIIILENCNLDDVVTVSSNAASTGGSVLGINTGDQITVESLLYGLMLKSRK